MLIGICSDSHDRFRALRRALELFDSLGVERIVHCGDVGGQRAFDELAGRDVHFVWGNTDEPDAALEAYLAAIGLSSPTAAPLRLDWAGKRLAVFHGHEPGFANAAEELSVDYILHGHTHAARDDRMGTVRIINPGVRCTARIKTVATLDLASDHLRFHQIDV